MANVGLKSFLYGDFDEEAGTYKSPSVLAGAIEFKESLTSNDAKLYADDELKESDSSVTGGELEMGIDDDDDAIFAPLLGKKTEKVTVGEQQYDVMISSTNDVPKAVGFGYITKKSSGKWKVIFYPKIEFTPYSVDGKTKSDKLEYTTPSVKATMYPVNSNYKKEATVDDEETAVKLLKAFFTPAA